MVGRVLNQYRILGPLGKGGMGEVYLAEDTELARKVALKLLPPEMAAVPQRIERFRREARAVAALSHPNIVTIYSVEEADGVHFLTMELVAGKTLDSLIPASGVTLERIFDVAIPLADALSDAHEKGVTHRDLKPANVMVTDDGRVKVLDFGLAKFRETTSGDDERQPTQTLTREGTLVGTLAYMSPEQVKGGAVDHRADIFALGVILYEMATGKRPFVGSSSAELISSLLRDSPPSASEVNAAVPRPLARIIRLCLEKDPQQRYQSAADVRNELRALRTELASGEVQAHAVPRASSRGPALALALCVGLLAGVVALIAWRFGGSGAAGAQVTVVVLPFGNASQDTALDYLTLAIPDEVTTTLSRAAGLSLRPFSSATRYAGPQVDLRAAGRELHATTIVTGQFFREGSDLQLTLEAVDVERNEIVWRDGVTVAGDDLIALRRQVAERIRSGLMPKLVGAGESVAAGTQPASPEAYDLYLRSLAIPDDTQPGLRATQMLERAVELDPRYAPAWAELGQRYHAEAAYGTGGDPFYARAVDALRRALELDPSLPVAAARLVTIEVESGELARAYDEARALVERFPRHSDAHFSLSYVLRYAGLLDEAGRECDAGYALDPTNPGLRSCGITFYLLGDHERAEVFLALSDSDFSVENRWTSLMRQGRDEDARSLLARSTVTPPRTFARRCLGGESPTDLAALVPPLETAVAVLRDGEQQYWSGAFLARCGQPQAALRLLSVAVERNYCAYPLLETDPLLVSLRSEPDFERIRAAGRACRERFLAHREGR